MRARPGIGLVALSILGASAWLPGGGAHAQERPHGSAVPCAAPLSWRIARLDREFGLDREEAGAAIRAAGGLWEGAVGHPLFRQEDDGFPIRFVYDHRQAQAVAWESRAAEVDSLRTELEARRASLEGRQEDYEREWSAFQQRLRDLDLRVSEHNATVRQWNARGGAPDDVARELQAIGETLDKERTTLERRGADLERQSRTLLVEQEGLGGEADHYTRRAEELSSSRPAESVEWGAYREYVRRTGGPEGPISSVSREIRVYRLPDRRTLVAIVAHELGHALGLGHTGGPGTIMSEEYQQTFGSAALARLSRLDVEALRDRCPQLFDDAPR